MSELNSQVEETSQNPQQQTPVNNSVNQSNLNQQIATNTSGQGKNSVVPPEVKGWSWGAFFWSLVWAVANRVWIGLLVLIPYVGLIMLPVLGFKGREWAWKSKHWDSIEQFNKVQRKWSFWGVLLMGTAWISILLLILIVIINPMRH